MLTDILACIFSHVGALICTHTCTGSRQTYAQEIIDWMLHQYSITHTYKHSDTLGTGSLCSANVEVFPCTIYQISEENPHMRGYESHRDMAVSINTAT